MANLGVCIAALIVGFILAVVFTGLLIPFLQKHQFKQFVREVGPQSHLSKTGTPSMGGLAIVGATVLSTVIIALIGGVFTKGLAAVLITMILFGVIGFIDDYEKAIKKNNKGISPKQKIVLQVAFSLAIAVFAYFFSGDYMTVGNTVECVNSAGIWIPIWKHLVNIGIFYIPWVMFVMVAFSNSVNLTDGLDGLASSVTAIVCVFMVVCAAMFGYLDQPVFFAALCGGVLGFLVYNHNPAKIFMGDTGSMALGGGLAAAAVMMKLEIILAVAGLLYVCEALSVIIQVAYFKKTGGKRFFKMAPLHHHFELCGLHEKKVVLLFDAATFVFCLIAFFLMK